MRTLHGGIERAVALANLDTWDARSIAATLRDHGERAVELTDRDVADLEGVLVDLSALFAEPDRDRAADRLNRLLAAHAGPPRLVRHEGWDWHLHADRSDDAPWSEWLAASAGLALAVLLAGSESVPWGVCAADGCGRAFVHDGRGGHRRWCSPTCASRERVRRHRRAARPGRSRGSRR